MLDDEKEAAMKRPVLVAMIEILVLVLLSGAAWSEAPSADPEANAPRVQPSESKSPDQAPESYVVKLATTAGDIIIDVKRNWAPNGADRFYDLVKRGYYDDVAFFRVIAGFMAQTGISGDPAQNSVWRSKRIPDDPVVESNTPGMVSFATSGPNSRTTQFFINFKNNGRLDSMGFSPFGKVRDMKTVDALYAGYGEGAPGGRGPSQQQMQTRGNEYLRSSFPKLDYIERATILE